ncbi:FAD-linked oxidoreductase [Schizopora paradoxa]|uniref:Proline dehydrogenase n=1 Tax=Schizopora paradoxa TaxID=27342 RepID=A0A0H2SKM6_9AGAM|nr:FAD-linked oxidoreductase [Schizopora paradoxa]
MLLARTRAIQRLFASSARSGRCLSTSQSATRTRWSRGTLLRAGALSSIVGCSALYYVAKPVYADAEAGSSASKSDETRKPSLSGLVRSYLVFTACSFPTIVDWSPAIISTCLSVPVVKDFTEAVLRRTFFSQFVGGDTAEDVLPLLTDLRNQNKGALFAYSVEVDEKEAAGVAKAGGSGSGETNSEPSFMRNVNEMIHSIDVAADFEDGLAGRNELDIGRKTWVAVKLTALLPDTNALIKLSSILLDNRTPNKQIAFPGIPSPSDLTVLHGKSTSDSRLSEADVKDLKQLHENLIRICTRAKKRGVRIIVDAEHSWYQPAIDAYTLSLMRTFNKLPSSTKASRTFGLTTTARADTEPGVQPLVYATFQAYLRRAYPYLLQSIADAQAGNYALGVKLVRGAYHTQEISSHHQQSGGKSLSISPEAEPPVYLQKSDTDFCYNECVRLLISRVREDVVASQRKSSNSPPTLGLLFGSHNVDSCNLVLDELVRNGLAEVKDGIIHVPETVAERVTIAQLYGMRDSLTNSLVEKTRCGVPLVMKYVPYGGLAEVMPYLSRRAIENKTVLGGSDGASAERKQAWEEIRKRVFG